MILIEDRRSSSSGMTETATCYRLDMDDDENAKIILRNLNERRKTENGLINTVTVCVSCI